MTGETEPPLQVTEPVVEKPFTGKINKGTVWASFKAGGLSDKDAEELFELIENP